MIVDNGQDHYFQIGTHDDRGWAPVYPPDWMLGLRVCHPFSIYGDRWL